MPRELLFRPLQIITCKCRHQDAYRKNDNHYISAIPIIFHILVDSAQFNDLGGTAGIIKRCDSQIAVLNQRLQQAEFRFYTDTIINWKALYGNVGIHFWLAHTDPNGLGTPGYEVKIVTATGFSDENNAFSNEKQAATGLAAWDVTKYYNVWCMNFNGSANGLLGITEPKSSATGANTNYQGVVILYNCLGLGHTDNPSRGNSCLLLQSWPYINS